MKMSKAGGFTLLEIIVSVSIVALMSAVISQVLLTTVRTNTKGGIINTVKQNGDFSLETMTRMIQSAQSVTSPACTSGGTSGTSLVIQNSDGGTTTLSCLLDSGVYRIASGSAFLTNSSITAADSGGTCTLAFICSSDAGIADTVQISFSLAQKGTTAAQYESASISFQTTVSLRNH